VFDLNHVLIHRKPTVHYKQRQMLIMRPHAMDFLLHMSKRFTLALWSSATRATCKAICNCLFTVEDGFDKSRFLFVWDQKQCDKEVIECEDGVKVVRGERGAENNDLDIQEIERRRSLFGSAIKPLMLKDVAKIWDKYPEFKHKVILIDDSVEKCERNPPGSYINPLAYNGPSETGEDFDDVFAIDGELATFLVSLAPKLPVLKGDTEEKEKEEEVEEEEEGEGEGEEHGAEESELYAKVNDYKKKLQQQH
jgi:hypothetical protein